MPETDGGNRDLVLETDGGSRDFVLEIDGRSREFVSCQKQMVKAGPRSGNRWWNQRTRVGNRWWK